jgi:hypothetical protein
VRTRTLISQASARGQHGSLPAPARTADDEIVFIAEDELDVNLGTTASSARTTLRSTFSP